MRFDEFMGQIPAPKPGAARLDRKARIDGTERDPLATPPKRALAVRLVAQAEQKLGPMDLPAEAWPGVVSALGDYSERDWRELSTINDLLPKRKGSRRRAGEGE